MKYIKIATLLIAGIISNNVQSMEQEYVLETQLFDTIISVSDYFLLLEQTSSQYAKMLKALRTAKYLTGDNLYQTLQNETAAQLQVVQQNFELLTEEDVAGEELWQGQVTKADIKARYSLFIHEEVTNGIRVFYQKLQNQIRTGKAIQNPYNMIKQREIGYKGKH